MGDAESIGTISDEVLEVKKMKAKVRSLIKELILNY
jgi:hypothetical protein